MCNVCRMQRTHAACLDCKYAVKRWMWNLGRCPHCRKDLVDMGVKWKTPKKGKWK